MVLSEQYTEEHGALRVISSVVEHGICLLLLISSSPSRFLVLFSIASTFFSLMLLGLTFFELPDRRRAGRRGARKLLSHMASNCRPKLPPWLSSSREVAAVDVAVEALSWVLYAIFVGPKSADSKVCRWFLFLPMRCMIVVSAQSMERLSISNECSVEVSDVALVTLNTNLKLKLENKHPVWFTKAVVYETLSSRRNRRWFTMEQTEL